MSLFEMFICFWVLPSLVSALITISFARYARDPIQTWGQESWRWFWVFSIVYPLVVVILICWPAEIISNVLADIRLSRRLRRSML